MAKCNFCGENLERGTGKMFVKKDGKVLHFCSTKCEKNTLKLGRKFLSTKWSSKFKKGATKSKRKKK